MLKILAGIAAMQPRVIFERHLIYKPRNRVTNGNKTNVKPSAPVSQIQSLQAQMHGDVFYLQLVGNMSDKSHVAPVGKSEDKVRPVALPENGSDSALNQAVVTTENLVSSEPTIDFAKYQWSVEFRDLPDVPGRRPVTSRLMASVPVVGGDLFHVMDSLGYNYVSEYLMQGHQLIHNNITLSLQRPFTIPLESETESGNGLPQCRVPIKILPSSGKLKILDPIGTFVLQASVRVHDGTKPESMAIAISELTSFKDLMRGIVDMELTGSDSQFSPEGIITHRSMDTSNSWQSVPGTTASFALVVNPGSGFQRILAKLESVNGVPIWLYQFQGEDHPSRLTIEEICEAISIRPAGIYSNITQIREVLLFRKSTIDEQMTRPVHFRESSELEKEFLQSVVWRSWTSSNTGLRVTGSGLDKPDQTALAKPKTQHSDAKRQTIPHTDTEEDQLWCSPPEAVVGLDRPHPQTATTEDTEVSDTCPAHNKASVHNRGPPLKDTSGLRKADLHYENTKHTYISDDRPADDGKRASEADAEEAPADLHELNITTPRYFTPPHTLTNMFGIIFGVFEIAILLLLKLLLKMMGLISIDLQEELYG
ncbi:Mediator of RNA polymerase II transcription subunit 18 [Xylographa pallens]|nr:Mediator of RNA polymerase II transcription subunit 18 [Xylographa pallens]